MNRAGTPLRPSAALAIVFAGALVAPLDTGVNVAFPAITRDFALELPEIRWLVIVYVLTYGALLLVGGRLGDLHGYRRVFGIGLAVVGVSFAACAAAPDYHFLLAARIGQGMGVALVLGCGPALALSLFPEAARTRVLGYYASMFAFGNALGFLAGGVLVSTLGWRAVFWIRIPLALAALVLLRLVHAARARAGNRAFDTTGAVLLTLWTGALVLAFSLPAGFHPWLALLAAAAFYWFVAHESRIAEPIVRPALFRDLRFALVNLLNVVANLATFAVPLLGPYYLMRASGLDALGVGMQLGAWASSTLAGAALAERLSRRYGLRQTGFVGVALSAAGLAVIATWDARTGAVAACISLVAQGFGAGVFQVAYADAVVAALPHRDRGVAGSLAMLTRTLGVVGGATLLTALFHHAEAAAMAAGAATEQAFVEGFRFAFRCVAAGLAVFLVVNWLTGWGRSQR